MPFLSDEIKEVCLVTLVKACPYCAGGGSGNTECSRCGGGGQESRLISLQSALEQLGVIQRINAIEDAIGIKRGGK